MGMTNAEAISLLKQALAEIEWTQPMQYAAAIDKAIEALEGKDKDVPTKWISCKDRLPVKTGEYIVCGIDEDGDYFVTSDQWFDTVRHWYLFDEHTDSVVTHWLVLPKPPMEGE